MTTRDHQPDQTDEAISMALAAADTLFRTFGTTAEDAAAWRQLSEAEQVAAYAADLDDDLQPYMERGPHGTLMLRHPLLYDLFMMLPPAVLNARYQQVRGRYLDACRAGEFRLALGWVEKPWRLRFLNEWQHQQVLLPSELRECLAFAWTATEFPSTALGKRDTLALFRAAGWMSDTVEGDVNHPDAPARPSIPLRLWRGCGHRYQRGLAWTADPLSAGWFARRWHKGGRMYQATVPPERLLACFNSRGEAEFVADVRGLVLTEVAVPSPAGWPDDSPALPGSEAPATPADAPA